jgi:hypothetical protein
LENSQDRPNVYISVADDVNNTVLKELMPNEVFAFKSREITEAFRSVAESKREESVHDGLDFDHLAVMDIV